jgi:hypothetical protein
MDAKNDPRTGLAEKVVTWLALGIPLLTAVIDLISKVVNYARPVPEFRLPVYPRR